MKPARFKPATPTTAEPFGRAVRRLRAAGKLTLAEVATRADISKAYLSLIENSRVANPPSRKVIDRLALALGVDPADLHTLADWQATPIGVRQAVQRLEDRAARGNALAGLLRDNAGQLDALFRSGELGRQVDAITGDDGRALAPAGPVRHSVPLINRVAAGYPTGFTDLDYPARVADDYVSAVDCDDADAFAACVCGDSMMPAYSSGDVIIFSPAAEVTNGCDCFVRLEPDHDTTFKRVFFDEAGQTRLQPLNPNFPPQVLSRQEVAGLYRAVGRYCRL